MEISDLKLKEFQLKSRGFDLMREQEALQRRMSQLQTEKNTVLTELQKLYQFVEDQRKQSQIASESQESNKPNAESTTIVPEEEITSGEVFGDNDLDTSELNETDNGQGNKVKTRIRNPRTTK